MFNLSVTFKRKQKQKQDDYIIDACNKYFDLLEKLGISPSVPNDQEESWKKVVYDEVRKIVNGEIKYERMLGEAYLFPDSISTAICMKYLKINPYVI